jgi:hypothetical protein
MCAKEGEEAQGTLFSRSDLLQKTLEGKPKRRETWERHI